MSTSESADPSGDVRQAELREPAMVDRASLEVLGLIFGGVTAVVIVIAVLVVYSHVMGHGAAESVAPVVLSPRR